MFRSVKVCCSLWYAVIIIKIINEKKKQHSYWETTKLCITVHSNPNRYCLWYLTLEWKRKVRRLHVKHIFVQMRQRQNTYSSLNLSYLPSVRPSNPLLHPKCFTYSQKVSVWLNRLPWSRLGSGKFSWWKGSSMLTLSVQLQTASETNHRRTDPLITEGDGAVTWSAQPQKMVG